MAGGGGGGKIQDGGHFESVRHWTPAEWRPISIGFQLILVPLGLLFLVSLGFLFFFYYYFLIF